MNRYLFVLACGAVLAFAADPWKDKKPADWSDKDAQRVLTGSPWAKSVSAEMDFSRMGGGGFGGGGGMRGGGGGGGMRGGGGGGGGMGGPGGGGGGMGEGPGGGGMGGPGGGMEAPKFVVRWESAMPVREAAAKSEDPVAAKIAELAKEYYVVSVSGTRMMGGGPGGGQRPQQDPSRMQDMQKRMIEATSLKRKGKDPIVPTSVQMVRGEKGMRTVFLFPRSVTRIWSSKPAWVR